MQIYYLHYFLANCNRKNPINKFSRLSYFSLQASDVAQLLAKVVTGCNLSRAVDDAKIWLLRVASRPV